MQFKQRIEQGLKGEYTGLANGFDRINKYIYNIQRSCYTLIGGLSGSSKTTLCDFILLNGLQDAKSKGVPFNVIVTLEALGDVPEYPLAPAVPAAPNVPLIAILVIQHHESLLK